MKRIQFISLAVLAFALSLGACQDVVTYDDGGYDPEPKAKGAPVIEDIVAIQNRDSVIYGGVLAQTIVLRGENLNGIKSIKFNDVAADIEEAYAAGTFLTLSVPRTLPTEINNQIVLETTKGTATTSFTINIPELVIDGLTNDFVMPGNTTLLKGANFDIYGITPTEGHITINGAPVVIVSVPDLYTLEVKLPTSATADFNQTMKVWGSQLDESEAYELTVRKCDQYLSNLSVPTTDRTIWPWGFTGGDAISGRTDGTHSGDPKPGSTVMEGYYLRFNATVGGWSDRRFFDMMTIPITNADALSHMEDYDLTFEILTQLPITARLQVEGSTNWYFLGEPIDDTKTFTTDGEWVTYSFPALRTNNGLTNGGEVGVVRKTVAMVFLARSNDGIQMDVSMANFRLVKKR